MRFGLSVYPAEVEAVLNAYPGVVRSAVFGRWVEGTKGEEVIAFVQLARNSSFGECRALATCRPTPCALQAADAALARGSHTADWQWKSDKKRAGYVPRERSHPVTTPSTRFYKGTSIRFGPSLLSPARSTSTKSSSELMRVPGTPMPFAMDTQSRSGRSISNMSRARGPGSPIPR